MTRPLTNVLRGSRLRRSSRDPFVHAIGVVAQVMEVGLISHPTNDWIDHPVEHHLEHLEAHLRAYRANDQSEDHLAHLCCRALMILALRKIRDS